jgi:N-acetylglutamate synthase-like GNAT family acetyltransferase
MIFQYSQIIKNKLEKIYKKYDVSTYNKYYLIGLSHIIQKIKSFTDNINEDFINNLFLNVSTQTDTIEKNIKKDKLEILLYLSNTQFSLKNCQGFIIYTKTTHSVTKKEKIYILLLCIDKPYRNFGYGKVFMEEFIEFIKKSNDKSKRIILHTLDSSFGFYQALGFIQISDKISNYKKLFKFEKLEKNSVILHLEL